MANKCVSVGIGTGAKILDQTEVVAVARQAFNNMGTNIKYFLADLTKADNSVAITPEGIGIAIKANEVFGTENEAAQGLTALEETENTAAGSHTSKIGQEIEQAATKVKSATNSDGIPLDERLRHSRAVGSRRPKRKWLGKHQMKLEKFENRLIREHGGIGEFEIISKKLSCKCQFDGAFDKYMV